MKQIFLSISDATLFNLSLLTSDIWGVLIATFLFQQSLHWLFFVAFVTIAVGLFIYSKTPLQEDLSSPTILTSRPRNESDTPLCQEEDSPELEGYSTIVEHQDSADE